MLNTYLPILIMMVLAAGFVVGMLFLSSVIGPKRRTAVKDDPFECGTLGTGDANQRFGVKFFLVAMIFILFDIEIVFMYPWAVNLSSLGWTAFYAIIPFLFIVELGLLYIWRRGVLDWL